MSLQGIKLVTFDATNTLLKFRTPPWQYYTVVAREFGFTGTSEDVKHRLLNSYKCMWDKYPNFGRSHIDWENWWKQVVRLTFKGHLSSSASIETIATKLIQEFQTPKCWCHAEDTDKIIQLLRENGIPYMGVVSNFDPRLYTILQSINLYDCFDFVVASYDAGYSKPDKRIFKLAIDQCIDVKPSQSLHIGDDVKKDYEGAKAAGWHALIVSNSIKVEKPPAPDHVFSSLKELCSAIEQKKLKL